MIAEALLTAEHSDQVLFKANMFKAEALVKQPGLVSYLNWRLKTIHFNLACSFGAFIKPSNQFKADVESFKAEAKEVYEILFRCFNREVQSHVWETIFCPVLLSLVKQLDKLSAETATASDSYIELLVGLLQRLVYQVPDSILGKTPLLKKFNLVAAQAYLRIADYEKS